MDGREAMALSGGSASYYLHRGEPGQAGSFHSPPGFRPSSNPNPNPNPNLSILSHSNVRGSSSVGSAFPEPSSHVNFSRGISISGFPRGGPSSEPVKRKRGRPRKYAPDGQVSLGLSPMSASSNQTPGSNSNAPKKNRGRPPGSGRKQQLALLGEWMNNSAGQAFTPHVIRIQPGEDIVARILSFSQQRPRAVCIMSGNGTVSSVTLRQPTSSTGVSVTYAGRFQILVLSGSYLVAEDGGPQNRTGGVSVSLSTPDGHIFGGGVAMLIASGPVQVVVSSFVYGGSKTKDKQAIVPKGDNELITLTASSPQQPTQNYTHSQPAAWHGARPVDTRNPHHSIDLMRG